MFTVHTLTMQTGVLMESHVYHLVPCVLSLSLFIHLCLAAPGLPGSNRVDSMDGHPPPPALPNPFGSGEEERGMLQSYIQSTLKNNQGGPEISSWEQEVFLLFHLYDYDRSGFLDGLEMMKLLSEYNSHHAPGAEASDQVVSMVDFLLQTQDLNQDGLLDPSELLSPSLTHTQGSSNRNVPSQKQEVAVNDKMTNTITEEENARAVEYRLDEAHEEISPPEEEGAQQGEEELVKQVDERNEQQIPEAPAEEQQPVHNVPVHQGQPEI